VPVRKKGVKAVHSGKTDLNSGKKAVIPVLSQGTFSNIIKVMVAGDLIREVPGLDNNRKEKYYSITPVGGLAFELAGIKP
jgi:hypothetical protein